MAKGGPTRLSDSDYAVLGHLQEHGRASSVELANVLGMSPGFCLKRMRALERSGLIQKYVALVDPGSVSQGITLFVHISLDLRVDGLDGFEHRIRQRPEVLECYLMTGESDYLLRVVVPDIEAYERFVKDALTQTDVTVVKSRFALREVSYSTALPLPVPSPAGNPPMPPDLVTRPPESSSRGHPARVDGRVGVRKSRQARARRGDSAS